jgi:hypothetical protein
MKDINLIPERHNELVKLYIEYQPDLLINFLRLSSHYSYPEAYKLVKAKDHIPEMLYLLGKMGDTRKALFLIVERLQNVEMAIEFAKEQNDDNLWEEFLEYARNKPRFIVGLLQNLSSFIDPKRVIERIPLDLEIPNLKDSIIKTMSDCSIQVSLRQGCEKIFQSDCWNTFLNLVKTQRRGMKLEITALECIVCSINLTLDSNQVYFFCGHSVHAECIGVNIKYTQYEKDANVTQFENVAIDSLYERKKTHGPSRRSPMWIDNGGLICPTCSSSK